PARHRRIHIAEIPFVGGNVAVGMLVPFPNDEIELRLGESRIDERERDAMESEVPGRVPRVLPGIRHRHHAFVVKVAPSGIASLFSLFRWWRKCRIAFQPLVNDVVIKLLRPKHPSERLALNRTFFSAQFSRTKLKIKLVCLGATLIEERLEICE